MVSHERPAFSPQPKKAPKLVAKKKAEAEKDTNWRKARKVVIGRDGKACRNCKQERGLDLHHVVFRSLGGKDVPENLVLLCHSCHRDVHGHVLKVRGVDAKSVWFERVA